MSGSSERFFPLTADDAAVGEQIYNSAHLAGTGDINDRLPFIYAISNLLLTNPLIHSFSAFLVGGMLNGVDDCEGFADAYMFGVISMSEMISNRAVTLGVKIPRMTGLDIADAMERESRIDADWEKNQNELINRINRWGQRGISAEKALKYELAEGQLDQSRIDSSNREMDRRMIRMQREPEVIRVFSKLIDPIGGLQSFRAMKPTSQLTFAGLTDPYVYLRHMLDK